MGSTHFLTKGLERVKTEMSLHVLAYNLKRLMAVLGIANMMEAIRAYALLLAIQRVFATATLLVWPQMHKNGDSAHNAAEYPGTGAPMCISAASMCF
jgi:hypothetical protein